MDRDARRCHLCGTFTRWVTLKDGTAAWINAAPAEDGVFIDITGGRFRELVPGETIEPGRSRYANHFRACPVFDNVFGGNGHARPAAGEDE